MMSVFDDSHYLLDIGKSSHILLKKNLIYRNIIIKERIEIVVSLKLFFLKFKLAKSFNASVALPLLDTS